MSLFGILSIGQSGTNASRAGVQVTGENVANASTPGYRRREVSITEQNPYYANGLVQGAGARVGATIRSANDALAGRVRLAGAQAGSASARAEVLQRTNAIIGDLGDDTLATSLDSLLNSFDALAAAPQDTIARNEVLQAASRFASDMNRYSNDLAGVRAEVDAQIENDVAAINGILTELAKLDERLPLGAPTDLDRRDILLGELGEIVDINVVMSSDNRPQVYLRHEGTGILRESGARVLTTRIGPSGDRVLEVQVAGGTRDVTHSLSGGRLAGLIEARDSDLAPLGSALDTLAFDLANTINAIHAAGYGSDGVTGRPLFVMSATSANAASTIAVDPSVDGNPAAIAAGQDPTLLPGDNTNALALSQVRDATVSGGLRASEALSGAFHLFGRSVDNADRSVRLTTQTHDQLAIIEAELTGVSIDEEMTKLIEYQRSYAAAARVIQTVDEMLGELISLKR